MPTGRNCGGRFSPRLTITVKKLYELGEYCWAQDKLFTAHSKCIAKICDAMESGIHVVCQHNTNVLRRESTEISERAYALGK